MKDGNPDNMQNWKLVCSGCAATYASDETIDIVDGHWQKEHADLGPTPAFNLVWCGKGPAPRKNRTRRRRY